MCCEWGEIGISNDSDIHFAKDMIIIREESQPDPNIVDQNDVLGIDIEKPKMIVRIIN